MTNQAAPTQISDRIIDRITGVPPWVLITQVFLGLGWSRAAVEKVIDPGWWSGEVIRDHLVEHSEAALPWFDPISHWVIEPFAPSVAWIVLFSQVMLGANYLLNRDIGATVGAGILLNLAFVASGAASPSAFYLVLQLCLGFWLIDGLPTRTQDRVSRLVATAGSILTAIAVPFVATLVPADVVEDPAMILMTIGGLGALGSMAIRLPVLTRHDESDLLQTESQFSYSEQRM